MTPRNLLLTGQVLDRTRKPLGELRRIVLLAHGVGRLRLLRGVGEAHVCDLKLRALYRLVVPELGELRVRVTGIDRYAGKRCMVHFKVLDEPST